MEPNGKCIAHLITPFFRSGCLYGGTEYQQVFAHYRSKNCSFTLLDIVTSTLPIVERSVVEILIL